MTDKASAWVRLPEELKQLPQWVVAGASKAPLSVDAHGKLFNTSVLKPGEWLTFETAFKVAYENQSLETHHSQNGKAVTQTGLDIGFILNDADPFTCIDLDVKDAVTNPDEPHLWVTPDDYDKYTEIYKTFGSYTERSRSGKGLHIWIRGDIGSGFRRDGVEVYSKERFIICTGDVFDPVFHGTIRDGQSILNNMISRMRPIPKDFNLVEVLAEEADWSILLRASEASNSDKFTALRQGKWRELGMPSQSEADLALMSMLAFYSESNAQCRALFRDSALGKRKKAAKDDRYLNLTLTTIRQRQQREQSANLHAIKTAADTFMEEEEKRKKKASEEVARLQGVPATQSEHSSRTAHALHVTGQGDPASVPPPPEVTMAGMSPVSLEVRTAGESGLPWPPGFLGKIAEFIYQSAPRPVKEVAIVAALGLVAGITGKAWHIPQSGLNLYVILIARSAIGKEAMHSGISTIISACARDNPMFHRFVDFTEYASGPALIKACVANPSFVNVSGEWGRKLKRLAQEDGRDGPLQTLRTQMTNLYQKSGPQSIVGGIGYSSTDNNVASVAGVSYSMIGETTPGTFYEALTESMMEDGFLSRFLVVEYDGQRPPSNEHPVKTPDDWLKSALNNMATQADLMIAKDHSEPVNRTEEAALVLKEFELECDKEINTARDDESKRQMWNRAALKVLRLSALLAVADNWLTPCITVEYVRWAQDLVRRDIAIMRKRLEGGDVGSGDSSRERKLVSVMRDYLSKPISPGYKIPDTMRQNSIVPRSFLQTRITRAAAFYNHKLGPNKALIDTVGAMIANGYLMEVQQDKVIEAYNYHGKSYRILRLPDYGADEES